MCPAIHSRFATLSFNPWLVDTNVISEIRRPRPNAAVIAFIENAAPNTLYISELSLAEIRFGIEAAFEPRLRAALTDWLAHQVRPMFDSRVLAVSEDVLLRWRLLLEQGRKAGHTYSQPDLILAATATGARYDPGDA